MLQRAFRKRQRAMEIKINTLDWIFTPYKLKHSSPISWLDISGCNFDKIINLSPPVRRYVTGLWGSNVSVNKTFVYDEENDKFEPRWLRLGRGVDWGTARWTLETREKTAHNCATQLRQTHTICTQLCNTITSNSHNWFTQLRITSHSYNASLVTQKGQIKYVWQNYTHLVYFWKYDWVIYGT